MALVVTSLLRRERELLTRVTRQRGELDELEPLRAALTPADVGSWPGLEVATCFVPAEGVVAGDFFLLTPGPAGSTTVVVGDVVGHGLEAARTASFVRAALSTFAGFTADPVRLLQLANTVLCERVEQRSKFVTVTCVNIVATDGRSPGPAPGTRRRGGWTTAPCSMAGAAECETSLPIMYSSVWPIIDFPCRL